MTQTSCSIKSPPPLLSAALLHPERNIQREVTVRPFSAQVEMFCYEDKHHQEYPTSIKCYCYNYGRHPSSSSYLFCLRLQMQPAKLGPLHRDSLRLQVERAKLGLSPDLEDNAQNCDGYVNTPSSQTYGFYFFY
jgi:hypothetical protein